jgi:hypothetical protein
MYDPENGKFGSLSNICDVTKSDDGQYTYTLNLRYHLDYTFDPNCET